MIKEKNMVEKSIQRLQYLCDTIPTILANISEEDFINKPNPNKWSKKEVLGHLIDSATNNHQRFIRTQFEIVPTIFYDQNSWNRYSNYNEMDTKHLISFWTSYNKHLIEIIKGINEENYKKECIIGKEKNVDLKWLIEDYVRHLEHHLKQITEY